MFSSLRRRLGVTLKRHVSPGAPPALLTTGNRDRLVEPGNSTPLAARLVAAGAPFLRFLVPVLRDVDAFIAETLRRPRQTVQQTLQQAAAVFETVGR